MTVEANVLPERYRGPQLIGSGGMGEIYRATDDALGRTVAVKVLAERFAQDPSVRERFTREALSAARLSGRPNIVTIFDVGEWRDRPYIVMEHLGGGSLDDRLREGAITPGQAIGWLDEAAAALDAAHLEGVVHRDVKPANLLLDREGHVHVADFGIASAAGMDTMTQTGTVMGTAGYLSPEQAQGERASPASDRYALGLVAWELLTGERPFESDTAAAEAAAHVHATVPRMSERRPDLPRELDAIFERALAKDPPVRYSSAAEFVGDLRHALYASAATTPAFGTAPAAVSRRRSSRSRLLLPAIVLLVLLAGGVALAAVLASTDDEGGTSTVAQRTTVVAQRTTIVRTVTEQGEPQQVTVTATLQVEPPPAQAPPQEQPEPEPPTSPAFSVSQARALQDESTAAMNGGDWERALALAQQALASLRGRDRTYEGYANFNVGNSLAHLDRCDEAMPYLDRREQLGGPHPAVEAARDLCS